MTVIVKKGVRKKANDADESIVDSAISSIDVRKRIKVVRENGFEPNESCGGLNAKRPAVRWTSSRQSRER